MKGLGYGLLKVLYVSPFLPSSPTCLGFRRDLYSFSLDTVVLRDGGISDEIIYYRRVCLFRFLHVDLLQSSPLMLRA